MKNYIKVLLKGAICLSTFLSISSCEDYLERTPDSIISEEQAFQNYANFQGYVEELYHCIPNFTLSNWVSSFNWGEDEIESTAGTFTFSYAVDRGNFWRWQVENGAGNTGWLDAPSANTNRDHHNKGLWPLAWYGIRKANMGLENLSMMIVATPEERQMIEGQLLFFRGWFHFMLIQYFGGLPYVDRVLPSDEQLTLPRLSYHECAEKAALDFERAARLLPINWDLTPTGQKTLNKNQLRINKIMALGYLGKNYLYAASPLMNSVSTGSQTYHQEYARKAADAFGELLQLVESGETQYALLPFERYHNNFYTTGQNWSLAGGTEAIFRSTYYSANGTNWRISKQYKPTFMDEGDPTNYYPTANYVHANFGMANGLPLPSDVTRADAESGYDPNHPWRGRDPRFYATIVYDGVKVVQGSIPDPNEEYNRFANLHRGGSYREVVTGSLSGYASRKFSPLTANKYDRAYDWGSSLHINVPYMRLADVYLMYAEAALMGYNSLGATSATFGKTPVEAVNVIRTRAGMVGVHDKFLGSVNSFLGELRRERAVELAFESHRFNDLRRWLLLTEFPYNIKTSYEFDRAGNFNADDPSQNRIINMREELIIERNFTSKHYWLPLKVSDVSLYPEFYQNPGW
ncbi:RagB/SusD family nutrient uptake outer membrane protein [Belliella kenyensis]|uniref:RagB/SusD family nutrient uptake outer membrane protein n=1 Tax=Belliella kenyensis TaxID=1472724 RepID=A0ABV8ES07_9BACT|nr:RagB/SusD family nutrient uptake outer membrane protein [Belliella kenyensis]MCH7402048.1 RagB/SusD family nutrient uptake outer membrane protein [Belliella kenyensis]MDN3605212.1 RagB/SusD family nutrient uptake outer membrane protein [Belliella kenyensis]